ncbi:hypothetical protein Barb6XT_01246 [Bacteroidales bacterium Barb6XT]|nr:hypothetical protein Barb6XT_01246 [Bacteroidales bacterium Barb6XT]
MQRRNFVKAVGIMAAVPAIQGIASPLAPASAKKEIYEWRIYTLTGSGDLPDAFFKDVLIPAYNRFGIQAGAFAPYKKEEEEKRHILFIYPDLETFHTVKKEIWNDAVFRKDAQPFFDASASSPAYAAFDTYLSEAFDRMPVHRTPDKSRGLFEIRIYRSPNEEANRRKVKMFNADEIDIFDKVGVNSVCYGEVFAAPRMPSVMYLTWYKDETARAEAWAKFGAHPDWQRIRALPEYAYTATDNQSIFLSPLPYSQL